MSSAKALSWKIETRIRCADFEPAATAEVLTEALIQDIFDVDSVPRIGFRRFFQKLGELPLAPRLGFHISDVKAFPRDPVNHMPGVANIDPKCRAGQPAGRAVFFRSRFVAKPPSGQRVSSLED